MFYKYRLHGADGSDAGEAHYAFLVKPGRPSLRAPAVGSVLSVVPVEEDESPYVGLLMVEAA